MPNEWISVEDRLPSDDGKYLCYDGEFIRIMSFTKSLYSVDNFVFYNNNYSGFYEYNGEYGYYEWDGVTHWMPLPEPPKEGADNA